MIKITSLMHNAHRSALVVLLCAVISLSGLGFNAVGLGQAKPQETVTAVPTPVAHFHHLHLNVTDPAAAISFYTTKFDCE
jgi:hypothetical protein